MSSRNNDFQKKAMTSQLNKIEPDESPSLLADTIEMDNDTDEFRTNGRHKVADLKAHNQTVKASFTIHTPKGSQTSLNNVKSTSTLSNFLPSNNLSESQKKLRSNNPFKNTRLIKNQHKPKNDEPVEQPDDFFDDETEFAVEEIDISITDSNIDKSIGKYYSLTMSKFIYI
jgi:hypothetical protein